MNNKLFVSIISILSLIININGFSQNSNLTKAIGNWSGVLELPTSNLELIFKISMTENDVLSAKFDVPLQGAKDLPVSEVKLIEDSLILKVAMISGTFEGAFESENKITGVWKQNGAELPLILKKTDTVTKLNRPQTPLKPFPYIEEEIEYINKNSGFKLAGTLTIPKNMEKIPAVILITGSGAQDRDETIFEHKMFFVLADFLTRNGIAVLRVDDRGVGGSEGNIKDATSKDFAGDIIAGIEFLKSKDKIDQTKIGLIGHSEGGIIAPIVATETDDIAFFVMLAGPGIIGSEILIEQNKLLLEASGMSESVISQNLQIVKGMVEILANETDSAKMLDRLQRTLSGGTYPMLDDEKKKLIDTKVASINNPWFRYFLSYDPYPTLTKVTCPALALAGEKDLQVPSKANLAAIKKALTEGGNKNFKTVELENLNHLFQNCEKGTVAEYAQIEETISPKVLEIVKDWILEVVQEEN